MLAKTLVHISALSGLALVAWTPFTFAPTLMPGQEKTQISDFEIKKLVAQLGDQTFKARESASKRLTEIGLPTLKFLEMAEKSTDIEVRNRATALVRIIREANRLPLKVNGIEFSLETDFKWIKPQNDQSQRIKLTLNAKNT